MSANATANEIDEFLNGALITWVCKFIGLYFIARFVYIYYCILLLIQSMKWFKNPKFI